MRDPAFFSPAIAAVPARSAEYKLLKQLEAKVLKLVMVPASGQKSLSAFASHDSLAAPLGALASLRVDSEDVIALYSTIHVLVGIAARQASEGRVDAALRSSIEAIVDAATSNQKPGRLWLLDGYFAGLRTIANADLWRPPVDRLHTATQRVCADLATNRLARRLGLKVPEPPQDWFVSVRSTTDPDDSTLRAAAPGHFRLSLQIFGHPVDVPVASSAASMREGHWIVRIEDSDRDAMVLSAGAAASNLPPEQAPFACDQLDQVPEALARIERDWTRRAFLRPGAGRVQGFRQRDAAALIAAWLLPSRT
jgi:hypothetical protein